MTRPIPYPLRSAWLISPEGAELVARVWETAHTVGKAERLAAALEARNGEPFDNDRKCIVTDGVAVMDIDGPLMRKADLFSDISGATSYQWIGATADALRLDAGVRSVIVRSNSPGGEAAGCGETAEKLARLAAAKHVEGYVETQSASAMMWLLSQCSHITAHPTSQAGWIGAVVEFYDTSARDKQDGVRRIQIVSRGADKKRSYPIDEGVIDGIQRRTDEWGRLFTEAVAIARGVSVETVLERFGGGEGMFAAQALEAGLIDEVGDFESTFARLAAGGEHITVGPARVAARIQGANMAIEKVTTAAAAQPEWQCAGCNEMMGPSAKSYCAKCAVDDDGDDDGDEDEDEAKALGLDPKATAAARRERTTALVDFERDVMAALGATSPREARTKLAHAVGAQATAEALAAKNAELAKDGIKRDLRAVLERGLMGAPGEQPRLSLGKVQKNLHIALRGPAKKAWMTAMDKLSTDADAAEDAEKKTIKASQVIDAACSVELTADDLEAVRDYVATSAPVAASTHIEPARNGEEESGELDELALKVKTAAERHRATLARNEARTPSSKPAAK